MLVYFVSSCSGNKISKNSNYLRYALLDSVLTLSFSVSAVAKPGVAILEWCSENV